MITAKQVADLLTIFRALLAVLFIRLGAMQGAAGLPAAVWMLLASWTSDSLDGTLARRSRRHYRTWIGDRDLEIDIAVAGGLLIFMVWAKLIHPYVAVFYTLAWMFIFWRWGVVRSLGMLVQAPVYGWFIWVAIRDAPEIGRWLVVWIVVAILVTWPRFPYKIVPEFLDGMRSIRERELRIPSSKGPTGRNGNGSGQDD